MTLDTLLHAAPRAQIAALRAGLPASDATDFAARQGLDGALVAQALGLSARTLQWRARTGQCLDLVASERLLRLASTAQHAQEAFGDAARASAWLARPNRLLGDAAPISLLDTGPGGDEVRRQLLAIEHGLPV